MRHEVGARYPTSPALIYMLVESVGIMGPCGAMILTRYTHKQLSPMIGPNKEAVIGALSGLQEAGP